VPSVNQNDNWLLLPYHQEATMTKKLKLLFRILALSFIVLILFLVYQGWRYILAPNVVLKNNKTYLYIPTGATYDDVCQILETGKYLRNIKTFKWLAHRKDYPLHVKAGRYRLIDGMNNNELINMLRAGRQAPVTLTLRKFRTLPQLAAFLGKNLEPDSAQFIRAFYNEKILSHYQLTPQTVITIFIPNTYYLFWNTDEKALIERMYKEFEAFWDSARMARARSLQLTPVEIITLASIVEEESNVKEEYPIIAGVYINRLRKGMPLQADPTVRYAMNGFQIKRILLKHLNYPSPYNTYLHQGLPPGPICTPSIAAIDGVLNYASHNYLYFCAKPDFSGRHVFAKTLIEHNKNARAYQQAVTNWLRKQKNS